MISSCRRTLPIQATPPLTSSHQRLLNSSLRIDVHRHQLQPHRGTILIRNPLTLTENPRFTSVFGAFTEISPQALLRSLDLPTYLGYPKHLRLTMTEPTAPIENSLASGTVASSSTTAPPSSDVEKTALERVHLPRIAIKFCTQCRWMLRAAYVWLSLFLLACQSLF